MFVKIKDTKKLDTLSLFNNLKVDPLDYFETLILLTILFSLLISSVSKYENGVRSIPSRGSMALIALAQFSLQNISSSVSGKYKYVSLYFSKSGAFSFTIIS